MAVFYFAAFEPDIPVALTPERLELMKGDIYALLLAQRLEVFENQGGASGPWKPLAISHFKRREMKVDPRRRNGRTDAVKILQDTGALRQSMTIDGSVGNVKNLNGNEVVLASNVPYARIQNSGGTINIPWQERTIFSRGGRFIADRKAFDQKTGEIRAGTAARRVVIPDHTVTIPARPFDEFSEENKAEINQVVERHVNGWK